MMRGLRDGDRARRAGRRGAAGFTVVELLMAIVVLLTAAFGILAFERAIVRSNEGANDVTAATYIADWWAGHARTESYLWRLGATDIADINRTPMLNAVTPALYSMPGGTTGWLPVPPVAPATEQPRFNRQLEEWSKTPAVPTDVGEFCTDYRLTVLVPDELWRIEVRVMWYKPFATRPDDWDVCPVPDMLDAHGDPDREKVRVVQVATTLWRNAQR